MYSNLGDLVKFYDYGRKEKYLMKVTENHLKELQLVSMAQRGVLSYSAFINTTKVNCFFSLTN